MFRKHICALTLLVFFAAVAPAQADKTDDFIKAEMQRQNIPGLSLAVVKDGQVIKTEGYGLANMKLKVPARPETVYRIASVSKQFIATGIMLLVQNGRLILDDSVTKYLEGAPETWKPIKIRHGTTYSYGFGWELGSFKGQRMVYHGGGGPGIRTKFARFVDYRLTSIVLINLDDVDVDSIVYGIANVYLPAPTTGRTSGQ